MRQKKKKKSQDSCAATGGELGRAGLYLAGSSRRTPWRHGDPVLGGPHSAVRAWFLCWSRDDPEVEFPLCSCPAGAGWGPPSVGLA